MCTHFRFGRAAWLGLCWLTIAPPPARPAGPEQRVFTVLVDGRPAGEYRLTVGADADGTETMTGVAAVRVRHVLGQYRYSYQGSEVWKDGRLVRLDAATDDDGKKCDVRAAAEAAGLRVEANGQARLAPLDSWPTTYWRLPPTERRGRPLTLLDVDTGQSLAARLDAVGPARLTVAGRPLDCTRYRVTGQAQAELWFDAQDRLVRQETIEDGHKTVLELRDVRP
jgi:hypothetical protein